MAYDGAPLAMLGPYMAQVCLFIHSVLQPRIGAGSPYCSVVSISIDHDGINSEKDMDDVSLA